jgi:hypothetical protein
MTIMTNVRRRSPPAAQLILLLIALALAACGGGGPRPGYTTQQQTVDGLTIGLERPQQPEVLKEYELFVTLADAEGRPIDGATVFLDMTMTTMPMAPLQPLADQLGNGQYRIKSLFTMDGAWKVTVHARVAGKEHTAVFDQEVVPQQ